MRIVLFLGPCWRIIDLDPEPADLSHCLGAAALAEGKLRLGSLRSAVATGPSSKTGSYFQSRAPGRPSPYIFNNHIIMNHGMRIILFLGALLGNN